MRSAPSSRSQRWWRPAGSAGCWSTSTPPRRPATSPMAFDDLGADLMSVSAHKLGGPRGIGALLVRRGLRVPPLLLGGDQERARRAGLENVAAAVGFGAAAAELAAPGALAAEAAAAVAQVTRLRAATEAIPGVEIYGPTEPDQPAPSPPLPRDRRGGGRAGADRA